MSYTLRLLTEESRDLVVAALRAGAEQRTRVASKASLDVAADKAQGRDVRSASVKVTALLAEAAQLGALADELAAAPDVPLLELATPEPPATITAEELATSLGVPVEEVTPQPDSDDGLSEAARAAMAQAEQFADEYLVDPDGADVDTNAIGEDEPADEDVVEVLP